MRVNERSSAPISPTPRSGMRTARSSSVRWPTIAASA
jgi:hypothetical protein